MHSDGFEFIMIISYSLFKDILSIFYLVCFYFARVCDARASRFRLQPLFHLPFLYIFFTPFLDAVIRRRKEGGKWQQQNEKNHHKLRNKHRAAVVAGAKKERTQASRATSQNNDDEVKKK